MGEKKRNEEEKKKKNEEGNERINKVPAYALIVLNSKDALTRGRKINNKIFRRYIIQSCA